MHVKDLIQDQIYRIQKIAAPVSLTLLTLNLSLTLYGLLSWRNVNPYLLIPLLFILIASVIILVANLNITYLKMHINERRTQVKHNPSTIYAFAPREIMMQRYTTLPLLKALNLPEAKMLEKWNNLGYIPKEDYDPALLQYYKDMGERV